MKWLKGYRIKLMLCGVVAAVVFGDGRAKADFIWTQKGDMPTPRMTHTSAVVNGKIYVIGGVSSEPGWEGLSNVEEYDPATDTWTRKANMPGARGDMVGSSAVVDGKIYVIGGGDYTDPAVWGCSTVEEYEPSTDTWTRKADMPTPRWSLATCVVDGKIYAIGGAPNSYTGLNVVEQYDPATDTWTRKADMPRGAWGLCACVVDGKIYAVGGRPYYLAEPQVQEYNPATDTWTQKRFLIMATSQMACVALGDKIFVIGGWRGSGMIVYTTVQVYDPKTDTWTREDDAPFLRAFVTAEVVRGRIFVIGGTDRPHPCPATSTVYELDTGFIPQLCDFNGDKIVDSADMCIMIENWGEDYHLCDIAPVPLGNGIVDIQDLLILVEHLFDDYRAVAQWKLDETEGDIAYDSSGDNDGTLNGNPFWQPNSGMKGGALLFDGVDDYISTPFVLDPAKGALSVFVWIKGGEPGQVLISQTGEFGGTWLGIDPSGKLMTGFSDQYFGTLESESVITDVQWHHIGLVWDGSYRYLYVDGVLVAKDTTFVAGLPSDGGLYIGVSKDLDAGTFFSGLIDDVRIYKRAVSP